MTGAKLYALLPVVLAVLALAGAQVARGVFTSVAPGGPTTIATATIAAPGSVEAEQVKCKSNRAPEVSVEWLASTSEGVSGYTVERSTSGGAYAQVAKLSASRRSYTDTGLAYSTSYVYRVAATVHSWSRVSTGVAVKTLSRTCG